MSPTHNIAQIIRSLPPEKHPEFFSVRGVGTDGGLPCLVTEGFHDLVSNLSGFARDLESAKRIVRMFAGRARIDFRPHEPNRIQVKVGAVKEHEEVLHRLYRGIGWCGNVLTRDVILWACDPAGCPGAAPHALRVYDRLRGEYDLLRESTGRSG